MPRCAVLQGPQTPYLVDMLDSNKAVNFPGNGPDNARVDVEVPRASFEIRQSGSARKSTESHLRVSHDPHRTDPTCLRTKVLFTIELVYHSAGHIPGRPAILSAKPLDGSVKSLLLTAPA